MISNYQDSTIADQINTIVKIKVKSISMKRSYLNIDD